MPTKQTQEHTCLQEVIAGASPRRWHVPLIIGHGREDAELRTQVLVNRHDGRDISASVTVVRRRPDCDHRAFREMVLRSVCQQGNKKCGIPKLTL
jgi:hypothetical protein